MSSAPEIREMIAENEVTMMRSYLEVDVAEWFSENEVPFAYEAFVIPSIVGPGKDRWDDTVDAIQKVGDGERDSVTLPNGDTMDAFDILSLWNDIYEKHDLAGERVSIQPNPALANFSKKMILPDFALYTDYGDKRAGEDFNWKSYDYIVEVSGLYGVGLPEESDESDWWDWYRVSAVAMKEFMYRVLGLWDDVRWIVPNQEGLESPPGSELAGIKDDDNYIVMDTTQMGIELPRLANEIGIAGGESNSGLSGIIQPTEYKRALDTKTSFQRGEISPVKYSYDSVNEDKVSENQNTVVIDGGFILYHGKMGEVYINNNGARVRESQWRRFNMIMLREYVLEVLRELDSDGIIKGLGEV